MLSLIITEGGGWQVRVLEFLFEAPCYWSLLSPSCEPLRGSCMVLITLRLSEPLGVFDTDYEPALPV